MQTRILLLAALSVASAAAVGQSPLRIDPEVQRQRDQTRVTILQDELVAEALGLVEVQKLVTDSVRGDPRMAQEASKRILRHRQNISALAKEIAATERQTGAAPKALPSPIQEAREPLPLAQVIPSAGARQPVPNERRAAPGAAPEWVISGAQRARTP